MADLTLVTGGTRSGKSTFAFERALEFGEERLFIATAEPFDDEMRERIALHKAERGDTFTTVDAPYDLASPLMSLPFTPSVILIDCLTVWLSNLMYKFESNPEQIDSAIDAFLKVLDSLPCECVLVTNEVGLGIVPENALARKFRDLAGALNRKVAAKAQMVFLVVCGIPVKIK